MGCLWLCAERAGADCVACARRVDGRGEDGVCLRCGDGHPQRQAGLPGGVAVLRPVERAGEHVQEQGAPHRQGRLHEAYRRRAGDGRDVPHHHRPLRQDAVLGGPVGRRRATYWCPELKADDPAKKGICSNFLCDTEPGAEVVMTGPAGKVMLMPEEDPTTDYIMVATGTGIAPFRGFVRRLFMEDTPAAAVYKGEAWLFLGVANSDALLYDDEFQDAKARNPENFRIDYALSREQENKKGGKMYIQDKVEEYADEIFEKLNNGAHIYFCGLKGMIPGIQDMLKGVAASKDLDYDAWLKGLKKSKQWHVEVY